MQNNNSKLNTVLLIIIIILLAVGVWLLAERDNDGEMDDRIESQIEQVDDLDEEEAVVEKPTEENPVVISKPVATTFKESGMSGICNMPTGPDSPPCTSTPKVTLNGSFDSKGSVTTTWFEYSAATSQNGQVTPVGSVKSTAHVTQTAPSGNVSQQISINQGTMYQFRIVTQNAGGTTYGQTLTFHTPIT